MEKYDYREAIINDLKDWIINETDILENINNVDNNDDVIEWIEDEAFSQDSITGNGSEYYDTEEKCSEYLSNNYDLLYEAAYEFCMDNDINGLIKHYKNKSLARYFDCAIRCYLLRECIDKVLEDIKNDSSTIN